MLKRLTRYLSKRHEKYEYGVILNEDGSIREKARRNKDTQKVEFVLWKAGEQGHQEDFWHVMGVGWEKRFQLTENNN